MEHSDTFDDNKDSIMAIVGSISKTEDNNYLEDLSKKTMENNDATAIVGTVSKIECENTCYDKDSTMTRVTTLDTKIMQLPIHNMFNYNDYCEDDKSNCRHLTASSSFLQTLNLKSKDKTLGSQYNNMSEPRVENIGVSSCDDYNLSIKTVTDPLNDSTCIDRPIQATNTYSPNPFKRHTDSRLPQQPSNASSYPKMLDNNSSRSSYNFFCNNNTTSADTGLHEFKTETDADTFSDMDNQNSLGKTLATSLHLIASGSVHNTLIPNVDSDIPVSDSMDALPPPNIEPSEPNSNDSVSPTTHDSDDLPHSLQYSSRSLAVVNDSYATVADDAQSDIDCNRDSKEERISSTEDEPFYRCDQCDKVFHKKQTLRQHFITHTDRFACKFCNVRCKSKGDLRSHTQTHTKEKPFHCEICNTFYTRESILRKHKTTQLHKSTCIKVEKRRNRKKKLKGQLSENCIQPWESAYTRKDKWVCSRCFKSFTNQNMLKKHFKIHDFSFTCSRCPRKCKSALLLRIHEKSHLKTSPLYCRICSRSFANNATLKEHFKSHFRQVDKYSKLHVKCHQVQKTTIPPVCAPESASDNPKTPVSRTAKKPKKQLELLLCQTCPRQFKSAKAFEKHCAKHLATVEQSKKDKSKIYSDKAINNLNDETSNCVDCNLSFDTIHSYAEHRDKIHDNQPMVCNICYSEFKDTIEYKNHIQDHAPKMLFSGESLEDSRVQPVTKKLSRRISGNRPAITDSQVSGSNITKTLSNIIKDQQSKENVDKKGNATDCENILSCIEFIKLLKNSVCESSDDGGPEDNADNENDSEDEHFFRGFRHLFHVDDVEFSNDTPNDDVDPSVVQYEGTDPSCAPTGLDHQSFIDGYTAHDFDNNQFKCVPCNISFLDSSELNNHVKSHCCDECHEYVIDAKTCMNHKCQSNRKVGREEFRTIYELARMNDTSSASEDEANDLFLDELESILDCESKTAPQIDLLHTYSHDEIVKANKKTFERYSCIDIPTNIYACTICKRKYARPTTLTRHFKTHVCHYCNKFFIDKSDLIEHKYKHRQKAALLKAEISGEQSSKILNSPLVSKVNRELIKKFTLIDSSRNLNKCCLCEKTFVRKTVLTRHMKTHICSYCDKFYEDKYELARHVVMHKIETQASEGSPEVREFNDFDDEKPFSSRSTLTDQMESDPKVVTLDPAFSSSIPHFSSTFATTDGNGHETLTFIEIPVPENCENTGNVAFGNNSEAVTSTYQIISNSIDAFKESAHESFIVDGSGCQPDDPNKIITIAQGQMLAGDGNQDRLNLFECAMCGKTFFKSRYLKSHMSTHSVRKPHACHLCGKSFVRRGALKRHEKSHDINKCKFCDASFNYQFELEDHMQMHDSYPFYK